jgi:3-methyladenine DNA glycosylase/8-oxoguanine DNA glycosylase
MVLHAPPTERDLVRAAPAELRRLGLHARRAATLVRLCSSLDLERLHGVPTHVAAARLERERGIGPWSAGLICSEGLGRWERGLVGDLGLIRLATQFIGRRADADDTRELLAPYGEWAGLAGKYMLNGWKHGVLEAPRSRGAAAAA